jgi:hypothetical protein
VRFAATASVGSPAAITVTAGAAQSDTVNQIVPVAPQVRVADKFNNPIQGNSVLFEVTGGGGVVAPTTAVSTLGNGTATVTSWRLGTAAGVNNNTLRATATGAGITGNPINITATAVAGPPASIAVVQGNGQTAVTGTNVATAPTVVVRDQYSNPVSGRTVSFTTTGGSVGTPAPTTGGTGQASTSWAPNVSGGSLQANGTFPDTLFATVQGTAFSTSFTASARYSFSTHVAPIMALNCSGCHGTWTHATLVNVNLSCNTSQTLIDQGYRRVSNAGGITAADEYSALMRLIDPGLTEIASCNHNPTTAKYAPGAPELTVFRAWIRNMAPNN